MNLLAIFEKKSQTFHLFLGFTLICVIGITDFLTGFELGFSVFYVLPIFFTTWLSGQRFGLIVSFISAFVWISADIATGHTYSHPLIPFWNTLIRLIFFIIITLLLSALRKAMIREGELARSDYLTGAVNSRFFYELTQIEINRFQRFQHPFTLAYLDLDNFKMVNDHFGHLIGDQVLRTVVSSLKNNIRKTDVVARLGGDEFALLLPETNEESARITLSKIQIALLEAMRQSNWPITLSIGVVTCTAAPQGIDELVRMTDELMYSVKRNNKNAIKFSTYTG